MIIKSIKPIIGIEKNIKPLMVFHKLQRKDCMVLYKGFEPHYQWFIQNQSKIYGKQYIYIFDRSKVNLAIEMAYRKCRKLMYVSTRNYQNVEIVPKNNFKDKQKGEIIFDSNTKGKMLNQKQGMKQQEGITDDVSLNARYILQNYDFKIRQSYLDYHPLEAYQKMCGYLMVKSSQQVIDLFSQYRCSEHHLFSDIILYPFLDEMRSKYLKTQSLKLKTLERRHFIPPKKSNIQSYDAKWRQLVNFQVLKSGNRSFDSLMLIQWAMQHKIGEFISKNRVLDGLYRNYSYGSML